MINNIKTNTNIQLKLVIKNAENNIFVQFNAVLSTKAEGSFLTASRSRLYSQIARENKIDSYTRNNKNILKQFRAILPTKAEELRMTASWTRLYCRTARGENRFRKLTVPQSWEPLMNHKHGFVQNSSCSKSARMMTLSGNNLKEVYSYVCTKCRY